MLDLCYVPFKATTTIIGAFFAAIPAALAVTAGYCFTHQQPIEGAEFAILAPLLAWMIKASYDQAKPQLIDFPNMLQQQLISARTLLDSFKQVLEAFESYPELRERIPALAKIEEFMNGVGFDSDELDSLIKLLETRTFEGAPSFFSRYGRVLRAFSLMSDLKYEFGSALQALGEVDAYLSMTKLMQEHAGKKNHLGENIGYSFVDFVESDTPYCKLTNFWCPLIDPATVVPASFELGGAGNASDAILTGPNTGGKSIAIKGLLINLILAQTFGITPAENVVMTPFAWIHTHMNIVDNPEAGESRFMAEALRAISIFDMVKACKDNEFCFIIIDEMFSGTEPIPGEECAFAFAEELARHRNSMSVIATHYRYLTMLPEQTNGAFKNYKVSVNRLENGALEFPYKLATGIADTNIALDILRLKLKDRGYETGFLNNAQMRVNQRRARG